MQIQSSVTTPVSCNIIKPLNLNFKTQLKPRNVVLWSEGHRLMSQMVVVGGETAKERNRFSASVIKGATAHSGSAAMLTHPKRAPEVHIWTGDTCQQEPPLPPTALACLSRRRRHPQARRCRALPAGQQSSCWSESPRTRRAPPPEQSGPGRRGSGSTTETDRRWAAAAHHLQGSTSQSIAHLLRSGQNSAGGRAHGCPGRCGGPPRPGDKGRKQGGVSERRQPGQRTERRRHVYNVVVDAAAMRKSSDRSSGPTAPPSGPAQPLHRGRKLQSPQKV